MVERTEAEIKRMAASGRTFAVFFHTPFCGTCRLAAQMLQALESEFSGFPLYGGNLNLMPELAQSWQIESVPCLAIVSGTVKQKMYAFDAVSVYQMLKPLADPAGEQH